VSDGRVARVQYWSLLSSEEKYESPYVVYLPEGHMDFHDILLYEDAAAKLAVDKAIS